MTAAAAPPAAAYAALRPLLRNLDLRLADAVAALDKERRALGLTTDDLDNFQPAELDAEIGRAPGAPRFDIDRAFALTNIAEGAFAHAAEVFGLSPFEADAILVAMAPDADRRYERLYRYLSPSGDGRATLDLILDLLCASPEEKFARHAELCSGSALIRFGLLAIEGGPEARALSRTALPAVPLVDALLGIAAAVPPAAGDIDRPTATRLAAVASRAGKDARPLACRLKGPFDEILRAAAAHLAGLLGKPLLLLDLDASGAGEPATAIQATLLRATLTDSVACIAGRPATFTQPVRAMLTTTPFRLVCPMIAAADGDWRLDAGTTPPFTKVDLPGPDYPLRLTVWRREARLARLRLPERDLETLASRFSLAAPAIARACRQAAADLGGTAFDRVLAAVKAGRGAALAESARLVESGQTWDDLVLPAGQMGQLREIVDQVTHSYTVDTKWGFAEGRTLGRAVCALFAGPSGTGKTMAAGIIARALDLDLYRIDLSRTVSKFIGETEKNLDRIFDQAREADAVLFFDEADTLFGKRTEVKDAHDRYANLEVGYLLQKMEEYDGLAILATNLRQHIDEAFIRRLRVIVEFPVPGAPERERIWRRMFPAKAPLAADIDFAALAREVRLTGGSIRNIALGAAFRAAAAGSPIRQAHLMEAARGEYGKVGRAWSGAGAAT